MNVTFFPKVTSFASFFSIIFSYCLLLIIFTQVCSILQQKNTFFQVLQRQKILPSVDPLSIALDHLTYRPSGFGANTHILA